MLPFLHIAHSPQAAAELGAALLAAALRRRPAARLALAGGNTPRPLYHALAREPELDWSQLELVLGDERLVPPEHPASNARMLREHLLERLGEPKPQFVPIDTTLPPAEAAACFARFVERRPPELVLLGMGSDAHVASLFAGGNGLAPGDPGAVLSHAPAPPHLRVSLSLDTINRAEHVFLFVLGPEKAAILATVLGQQLALATHTLDASDPKLLPAARLAPRSALHWILDAAAAAELRLASLCQGAPT